MLCPFFTLGYQSRKVLILVVVEYALCDKSLIVGAIALMNGS